MAAMNRAGNASCGQRLPASNSAPSRPQTAALPIDQRPAPSQNIPLGYRVLRESVAADTVPANTETSINNCQSHSSASSSSRARQGWWHWARDTNLTLNVISVVIGLLGVIAAAIFGTAAWIQSGDSHASLKVAQWQSCISNPNNPASVHAVFERSDPFHINDLNTHSDANREPLTANSTVSVV
jgi:hypothetical protein